MTRASSPSSSTRRCTRSAKRPSLGSKYSRSTEVTSWPTPIAVFVESLAQLEEHPLDLVPDRAHVDLAARGAQRKHADPQRGDRELRAAARVGDREDLVDHLGVANLQPQIEDAVGEHGLFEFGVEREAGIGWVGSSRPCWIGSRMGSSVPVPTLREARDGSGHGARDQGRNRAPQPSVEEQSQSSPRRPPVNPESPLTRVRRPDVRRVARS